MITSQNYNDRKLQNLKYKDQNESFESARTKIN